MCCSFHTHIHKKWMSRKGCLTEPDFQVLTELASTYDNITFPEVWFSIANHFNKKKNCRWGDVQNWSVISYGFRTLRFRVLNYVKDSAKSCYKQPFSLLTSKFSCLWWTNCEDYLFSLWDDCSEWKVKIRLLGLFSCLITATPGYKARASVSQKSEISSLFPVIFISLWSMKLEHAHQCL